MRRGLRSNRAPGRAPIDSGVLVFHMRRVHKPGVRGSEIAALSRAMDATAFAENL